MKTTISSSLWRYLTVLEGPILPLRAKILIDFFLWFALGMMTEPMSEFVTSTVPVLQEAVNQEMAMISHYTAARSQSSAIFKQNLLTGLGWTLLFDMTSFRATTPSCKKKGSVFIVHQTGMEIVKISRKKRRKEKRHSHWLDQRTGPFPAIQEKHDESVCHIHVQQKTASSEKCFNWQFFEQFYILLLLRLHLRNAQRHEAHHVSPKLVCILYILQGKAS